MKKNGNRLTIGILFLLVLFVVIQEEKIPATSTSTTITQYSPSTIETDTWNNVTVEAFQRKTFFAHNRYWAFFAKGPEIKYATSIDGITWSYAKRVCDGGPDSGLFSLWFDTTYVHYVRSTGIPTESFLYRRGMPNSDGTITWSTPTEEVVINTTSLSFHEPFIAVDSDGYPWIAYRWGTNGERYPNCTKSMFNNGTWKTAPGFPYMLSLEAKPNWAVSIVPLTQRKMYAVYLSEGTVRGRLWNGTAFCEEETIAKASIVGRTRFAHSVVSREDTVYLTFLNVSLTNNILFSMRNLTGWSALETIQTAVNTTSFPILSINSSNSDLYCFWANNDVIYYKRRVEKLWETNATTWLVEVNLREDSLTCFYEAWGSRIGVMWVRGAPYIWYIRFCSIITGTVTTLTITSTAGGTTNPPPGTYHYIAESLVDITAMPSTGYSFDYWLLDGEEKTENPLSVFMDKNHTLEAVFVDDISPYISTPRQEPSKDIVAFQNVTVNVNVTDFGTGVHNVTLWYNINGSANWLPLNMTKKAEDTYQTTIPGYKNCTWITYKIVAYDNAGNEAVNDNGGQGYRYHIVPEITPSLFLVFSLITAILLVMYHRKKKHCQKYSKNRYITSTQV